MNIIQALDDQKLLKPCLKGESWHEWRMVLKALFALPMDNNELQIFKAITGRDTPPQKPVKEGWFIAGRRSGKSNVSALIAVYLAAFVDYRQHLASGEYATVMLLAADRDQARTLIRYVKGILHDVPMLSSLIESESKESITLKGRVIIEIHTAGFRAVRGYTVVAAICDEAAFWRSDDTANPDLEVLAALRPAMLTIPNAMLLGISSPYRRAGALWEAYRDHYGKDDDDILVLKASSRIMNPSLPQADIDAAYARDPASASAEYGAEFRSDISGFLDSNWIDRVANLPDGELPPINGIRYFGFIDPSGGRKDSMTIGIAHAEASGQVVLDVIRGRKPPFEPSSVVYEFTDILKRYGLTRATADRYGAEWVSAEFRKAGITLEASSKSKSDIYLEIEPLFAQGGLQIPDNHKLLSEFRQLERRTTRSGKDSVDHPREAHDDFANSAAGALWLASQPRIVSLPSIRQL